MWNSHLAARARQYSSATLSTVGDPGYPRSVRCRPYLDDSRQVISLKDLPPMAREWRGAACLLLHRHDARLENQYQLLIRGHLVERDSSLQLENTAFVTANGARDHDQMPHAGAPLQLLHFMLLGRRQAAAYLRGRPTSWPVDFAPMLRVVQELRARR